MKGVDAKVMAKMVITQLPLKCPAEASVVGAIYKKMYRRNGYSISLFEMNFKKIDWIIIVR